MKRFLAQRRLPSMMMATCCGKGAVRGGDNRSSQSKKILDFRASPGVFSGLIEGLAQQKRCKAVELGCVFTAEWRHVLCVPFIYPVLMLMLDAFVTVYQWVCFPLCGRPRVKRSSCFVYDRTHLAYLNWLEKINCAYCAYGNGLMAYGREVVGLTEKYWCPIKHARRRMQAHAHDHDFADYGDAENYRAELTRLRAELTRWRASEGRSSR